LSNVHKSYIAPVILYISPNSSLLKPEGFSWVCGKIVALWCFYYLHRKK